jgi:methionine-rich copper-binding protein CopC
MKTWPKGSGTLLALLLVLAWVEHTAAHAVPEFSNPPIDGIVTEVPSRLDVVFTEEIVPDGTTLEVFSLEGRKVDEGDVEADLDDPERRRVSIGLESDIAPGRYIVQWTSFSAIDNDEVSGSFGFAIDPTATPVASPAPGQAVATPASAPPAEEPAANQDDDDGGNSTTLLVGIVVAASFAALALVDWRNRATIAPAPERDEP